MYRISNAFDHVWKFFSRNHQRYRCLLSCSSRENSKQKTIYTIIVRGGKRLQNSKKSNVYQDGWVFPLIFQTYQFFRSAPGSARDGFFLFLRKYRSKEIFFFFYFHCNQSFLLQRKFWETVETSQRQNGVYYESTWPGTRFHVQHSFVDYCRESAAGICRHPAIDPLINLRPVIYYVIFE